MGRPTHVSIENMRNELAKIGASIKTLHTLLSKGTKFGYAAEIMTDGEYRKRVTYLDPTWVFMKPTKPSAYDQIIKNQTQI